MERKIKRVEFALENAPKRKRVAAYARVSSGKEAMLESLSAQISYYSDFIQRNPEWEYAGVYSDEAISGTRDSRTEFQRLINDCKSQKIDLIITKSISHFARNTVTMLETIRMLKEHNVDVFFEKENVRKRAYRSAKIANGASERSSRKGGPAALSAPATFVFILLFWISSFTIHPAFYKH